jgi:hypothetical protein
MIAMWSKSFGLLFYLKKPKNYVRGKLPVYLRITIDAARVELSAQRECAPERWNAQVDLQQKNEQKIKRLAVDKLIVFPFVPVSGIPGWNGFFPGCT